MAARYLPPGASEAFTDANDEVHGNKTSRS
jgi:hypothetical protein